MNKYKLIAIFGEAGSGKDFVVKELLQLPFGKEYLHKVVGYTTRPMREGEEEGVQYHFLSSPQDLFKKDLIEHSEFRHWFYGSDISCLDPNKINIGIYDLKRIQDILKRDDIECYPIYIKASDKTRLIRQLEREENPDCNEIIRRFMADRADYINIKYPSFKFKFFTIENDDNRFSLLNTIIDYIKEEVLNDKDKMEE